MTTKKTTTMNQNDSTSNNNQLLLPPPSDQKFNSNSIVIVNKTKQQQQQQQQHNMMIFDDQNDRKILEDFSCGIFSWHPKYMQKFANKKCFLALFCLTSVLQGIYYTYFVSVLTTIEKLYQVQSRTTGIIMSSTEMGQISGALLLTYYGGQGHRPRWIATGMLVFAFAALLCSTPHYLFGSQPEQILTDNDDVSSSSSSPLSNIICMINSTTEQSCNQTSDIVIKKSRVNNFVLAIFFMSLLMIGLGTTAVNTLGIPYIDDNVAPKESPLYFGITIGVRIFGPVCGFLLGSVCTSIPVQFPFGTSDLHPNDPNWIGAWWLGLFLVGVSLALASIPMMIFPRRLPQPDPSSYCHRQQQQQKIEQENLLKLHQEKQMNNPNRTDELNNTELVTFCDNNSPSINVSIDSIEKIKSPNDLKLIELSKVEENGGGGGFSQALKRLLTNDILLCRTASSVLHILPISGLYTFLPKYLESQFQLTATDANMIAGLAGILVMGFGIFASGTFMRRYNPSARCVAKWIAFAALSYVIGMIILMFLGCPTNQFAGIKQHDDDIDRSHDYFLDINNEKLSCSYDCDCQQGRFEPVCMADGITYISPCLAGCTSVFGNGSEKFYSDCRCERNLNNNNNNTTMKARPGICPLECNTLTLYIVIFSLTVLIHSTSEVGSMLLTLRCVEPRDKAMALGFISFATGLFGNVPCPILYGSVIDSTCLFWEENCGKIGACRLYDSTSFRQLFHGLTALIMFFAFCIDLIVCYKASAIRFNDETHDKNDNQIIATTTTTNVQQQQAQQS